METINIDQAKNNLSRLLSRVELGEEIVVPCRLNNQDPMPLNYI
jgi:antitoxin (DNA-binding transcriptional repressor) of toxin-antitoxin stability system